MAKAIRELIVLRCSGCKRKNYPATRNKRTTQEKYQFKKFCRFCRTHTLHVETKVK